MKKILSLLLSALMIFSLITVLAGIPSSAATAVECEPGGTVTETADGYTAVAYYGNAFKGWYKDGALVSKAATISAAEADGVVASFTGSNQVPDGNFSAGTGVDFWKSIINNKNIFIATEGTGLEGSGLNIETKGNCLMTARVPVSVKKNTNYVFSYNMKINSYSATQKLDETTGQYVDLGTPVFSPMVSGSPDGTAGWGHWPKLGSWKLTIRNAEDYTKAYTLSGTNAVCQPQIKFADISSHCGEGWLEFIFEFNTGEDTAYSNDGNIFETSDSGKMVMATGANYAVSNMDFDNFSFYEASYSPVFNHKENVSFSRVGIGTVAAGSTYSFKINKDDNATATVTYNKSTVTPVNGVYTLNLVSDRNVYVSLSDDANYPEKGKDFEGNDLTKYDHTLYNIPVWEGNTVYHETVVFYPGRTEIELIYPIDRIVSVRSFDLQQYYVKGYDFDVVDGKLVLLPGSSIPVYPHTPLKPTGQGSWASDYDGYDVTGYSGGSVFPCTLAVTYEHSKTWAECNQSGYTETKQESVADSLSVYDKLANGEDVHIVFYGDSMTSGWSISGGKVNVYTAANDGTLTESGLYVAPFAPSWMQMFIEGLRKEYPTANITWENLSLGGKDSKWGLQNFEARYSLLKNKDIDLFLLGWGINDCGAGRTPADYKINEQAIIDAVRAKCSDVSVLMYSGNCTNVEAAMYDRETILGYQNAINELAEENENAATTVLSSLFFDVMNNKESSDIFENNLNHTNDFGCRLYSQVMLSAMEGTHSYENVVAEKTYSDTDKKLDGYEAEMGDTYTQVVDSDNSVYSYPVSVTAGEKYLVHLKLLPITFSSGSTFKVSVTSADKNWTEADCSSSIRLSTKEGTKAQSGTIETNWDADGFVDVYAVIDATSTGTVYLTLGQPAGGAFAVDNFTAVNVDSFAPTMVGATFNPEEDPDATEIMYVTNVSLPSYVAIGKISTYMGVTSQLTASGKQHNFTSEDENVTAATLTAYSSVGYITKPGNREAFRSGDLYSKFAGANEAAATTKYSVRTVLSITDAFGNSLDFEVCTNNNGNGIENGVYSRSINQVKRLLAKNLINENSGNRSLATKLISYNDPNKLYNGPIDQVWNFIVTCVNYGNVDNPGEFPEIGEEGDDDFIEE